MLEQKILKLSDTPCMKQATVYTDNSVPLKAAVLYFHGGGLLYGHREDLPSLHLKALTEAGYAVIAFDYPLAPAARLDTILKDVSASVAHYTENPSFYINEELPCFLWGRSAGAYLCLLACAKASLPSPPKGVISYYGYGFLCDNWFKSPSEHYRSLPAVDVSCLKELSDSLRMEGAIDTHYSVYVYARQAGTWMDLIYEGREKYFYLDYTLRTCTSLPCPLFCAHSMNDTDVPYGEFLELTSRFCARQFIVPGNIHDFDRYETNPFTKKLIKATIQFLDQQI